VFKEKLVPVFHKLVSQFSLLLDSNRPYQDRQWGIAIFADVIEYGGEVGIIYFFAFTVTDVSFSGQHPVPVHLSRANAQGAAE
jgi:hypothetical protein